MSKKILVGIDFSACSVNALEHAITIAQKIRPPLDCHAFQKLVGSCSPSLGTDSVHNPITIIAAPIRQSAIFYPSFFRRLELMKLSISVFRNKTLRPSLTDETRFWYVHSLRVTGDMRSI
jgi:hypothetical protein